MTAPKFSNSRSAAVGYMRHGLGYHESMAKNPVNRETVKKLLDTLTPMNPETAERFVQDILRLAEERRREVERLVGDVAKAGVRTAEGLASSVQHELARQVTKMAARIDDLERQVDSLGRALEATRTNLLSLASRSSGEVSSDLSESPKKAKKKGDKKADRKAAKSERRAREAAAEREAAVDGASGTTSGAERTSDVSAPAVAGI
jgi:polyhydroxyalkanoate synthesis regulator phasin